MIAGAVLVADLVVHAQFVSTRDRLHKELEAQFSLFARLDPPTAVELDPKLHAPHPAPALQIARNIVAVDGRPIAPLSVAHSPEGESNIGRDLSQALAARAAREDDAETDLAVSIDREVPWRSVVGLLDVARRSGVRTAELLLTRGPALAVPDGAPPEASWVLASDFVAVRIELADDGFRTGPDESFGRVAAQLVDRALAGGEPIVIATKQP
jgi:hypothetical protein